MPHACTIREVGKLSSRQTFRTADSNTPRIKIQISLAQVQRLKHCDALLAQRVVHYLADVVDDHGGAILGVICGPVWQLRSVWIPGACKGNPGIADLVGEGHGVRSS